MQIYRTVWTFESKSLVLPLTSPPAVKEQAQNRGDNKMSTISNEADKATRAPVVEAVELHDIQRSNEDADSTRESENWEPGFWKRFPWMGFGCLFMAILITVAEIIILVMSDGKSVSQWTVRGKSVAPNVILSVLNSVRTDPRLYCSEFGTDSHEVCWCMLRHRSCSGNRYLVVEESHAGSHDQGSA